MDPINQANPVLDALRRQLAQNVERLRKAGRLGGGRAAARAGAASPRTSLDAALLERLGGAEAGRLGAAAAARVFVETVLVAEFGAELASDPGFGPMVEEISNAFREDPSVREDFERMLSELRTAR